MTKRHSFLLRGSFLFFIFFSVTAAAVESPYPRGEQLLTGNEVSLHNPSSHGERLVREQGQVKAFTIGGTRWMGTVDGQDQRLIRGFGAPILQAGASLGETHVRLMELVRREARLFQVNPDELKLDRERSLRFEEVQTVVYRRVMGGVELDSAEVAFRFSRGGLVQIQNRTFGQINAIDIPLHTREEARSAIYADAEFDESHDKEVGQIGVVVAPYRDQDNRLRFEAVYRLAIFKLRPYGIWNYYVSGKTNQIVKLFNTLKYEHQGRVGGRVTARLASDPVRLVGFPDVLVKLVEREEPLDQTLSNKEGFFKTEMEGDGLLAMLSGRRFRVINRSGNSAKSQIPLLRDVGEYVSLIRFDENNSTLDETNAFFHANRVVQWASEYLQLRQFESQMQVNVGIRNHPFIKDCNAFFDPRNETLNFFPESERCVSSAMVADIVYHEWGHALDHYLGGIRDGAYSEAIGDIVSLHMTLDPIVGRDFRKSGPRRYIRNLGEPVKYDPNQRFDDPHHEGLIFGSAWFNLLRTFVEAYGEQEGYAISKRLFLRHLTTSSYYTEAYENILLHDDDDGNLGNGTPHYCEINRVFSFHNLTRPDSRCAG